MFPRLCFETRLATEIYEAMQSDPMYGPKHDKQRHFLGIEYEVALERELLSMGECPSERRSVANNLLFAESRPHSQLVFQEFLSKQNRSSEKKDRHERLMFSSLAPLPSKLMASGGLYAGLIRR